MNCPACSAEIAEGTAICPKCDHIIDASFLDGSSEEPRQEAPRKPAPRPTTGKSAVRPASKPATGARPAAARPGGTGQRPAAAKPRPSTPASGAPARRPAPPPPKAARDDEPTGGMVTSTSPGNPRITGSTKIVSPEEMLSDIKNFVLELGRSDKLAFLGALGVVLLEFVPWKSTAVDGDVIGFVTSGFLVLITSILTMSVIAIRVRKVMPQLNPIAPWLTQLGCAAFGVLWCLIFMKLSYDGTKVQATEGNQILDISSPSFGVFLALISSAVSLAGTLMGLKEKPH